MEPRTGIEPVNLRGTNAALCQLSYLGSKDCGCGGWVRTGTSVVNNHPLYRLSYTAVDRARRGALVGSG